MSNGSDTNHLPTTPYDTPRLRRFTPVRQIHSETKPRARAFLAHAKLARTSRCRDGGSDRPTPPEAHTHGPVSPVATTAGGG